MKTILDIESKKNLIRLAVVIAVLWLASCTKKEALPLPDAYLTVQIDSQRVEAYLYTTHFIHTQKADSAVLQVLGGHKIIDTRQTISFKPEIHYIPVGMPNVKIYVSYYYKHQLIRRVNALIQ